MSYELGILHNILDYIYMENITEDLKRGDFSSFEKLSETQKGRIEKNWDKEMRLKYLTRHEAMSETDFFSQLEENVDETAE